ncbi:MAG: DNA polymerase III subunit delta [Candidatus Falkowbacteria bacterium]
MIIFLYGEDNFRSRQKLKELKEKFSRDVDPSGNSLTIIDGESANLEKISSAVGAGTLFAKKRMIVIENLFKNKTQTIFDQVFEYFKNKDLDSIIIFWESCIKIKKTRNKQQVLKIDSSGKEKALPAYNKKLFNFLSKQQYAQQFSALSNIESSNWTKKEVEARGGKISYQAANMISAITGNDLWQINNEINKLLSYKKNSIIENTDVELMARGNFDENIFALTDAISAKNKPLTAKLLEDQSDAGMADSHLLIMIVRQFKILAQIRQSLDLGLTSRKMISLLKLHPFIIQKGINQVRNFTLNDLKNILKELIKIDYSLKTGRADAKTMLNLLFAKL